MAKRGFSFIELLLALGILVIVMGLGYGAVIQIVRMQLDQEAATSAQTRMRRVVEILSQDLRSMLYGAVTNTPYTSGNAAISFVVLDGGAGYQVLPPSSGNLADFPSATALSVVSLVANAADTGLGAGNQVLMVNNGGQGVFLPVSDFSNSGSNRWLLSHAGCTNTIAYTPNANLSAPLLYRVRAMGYQYDASRRTLYWKVNNGAAVPVALNITRFEIKYVYRNSGGSEVVNPAGYNDSGSPAQQFSSGGQSYTLRRIGLVLATTERTLGRFIERTYTSQIELPSSNSVPLREVLPCS